MCRRKGPERTLPGDQSGLHQAGVLGLGAAGARSLARAGVV